MARRSYIGAMFIWWQVPFTQCIPRFIVMPTLFFVGLMSIADSFVLPLPTNEPTALSPFNFQAQLNASSSASVEGKPERTPVGRTLYFLPAAMTTVLTTTSTLDVAIAAGILSYGIISAFPEKYLGVAETNSLQLVILYLGAFFVLVFSLGNSFAP